MPLDSLRPSLLFLNISLLIGGCALLPDDSQRAKLRDMPAMQQTLQPSQGSVEKTRAWPRAQWWLQFHNAELQRLIETALRDSPTLRTAAARLQQAQATADAQAAEMLPTIGASAILTHRRFSGTDFYGPTGGHTFTGAYLDPFVFRYHLDLWGKDRALLDTALGQEQAQHAELAMAQLLLSTSIARTYFQLYTSADDAELAEALLANAEAKRQLAEQRWQYGLTSQDNVYAARQAQSDAQQRLTALQTQVQILRNKLAALAGQGPDWGKSIAIAHSDVAERFPLPESLPLGLLAHRPDVAAALWRVEAAAKMIKVAETRFYPDVDLVGFAGLRSLNLKDLFLSNGASLAYSIGPTVSLPIFEGGRLEAALQNEQAGYDAAVETYNAALLDAVRQVADALAHWQDSLVQDAAQQQALQAAQSEAELATQRFQAGLSERDAELAAEERLLEQRLKNSQLHKDHLQAAIDLIEALGGGYESSNLPKPL